MHMLSASPRFVQKVQSQKARSVFNNLITGPRGSDEREGAALFLAGQLAHAEQLESDLPGHADDLEEWMLQGVENVGQQYRRYLAERKAGKERSYFRNRAQALYFLKGVAPTKLVDGAWLYGLVSHWEDPRFLALIQTYLEELGDGIPDKNHVALYRHLLAANDCSHWNNLSDEHYLQGAIQLSLAYNANRFLPEIIGFNLGYEQLPLHLLITAYELKELSIDPYYFTLHVTVDNADSGHAKKAVSAVSEAMPKGSDARDFYRRVQNGYKLNSLGVSTEVIIAEFNLERELGAIFSRKGSIGQYAHSDYRLVGDRSVNDWLSDSTRTSAFIRAMEDSGWFQRHQDPQNSRFWKLIHSEKAKMFGVFDAYEQQVIYDWIAGDAANSLPSKPARASTNNALCKEERERLVHSASKPPRHPATPPTKPASDFDTEANALQASVASANNLQEAMQVLIPWLSPARHHTATGLLATRIFADLLA